MKAVFTTICVRSREWDDVRMLKSVQEYQAPLLIAKSLIIRFIALTLLNPYLFPYYTNLLALIDHQYQFLIDQKKL